MSFDRILPALTITVLLCGLALVPGTASAQEPGPFGLGVQVGEPAGISGKYWMSGKTAVDGVVAWSFPEDGALHLQGDLLFHTFDFFEMEQGDLPFYYGIGGRIRFEDGDDRVGVRFPVGLDYIFEDAPVDIYLEIAPILDLAPETEVTANGGLGARYFF